MSEAMMRTTMTTHWLRLLLVLVNLMVTKLSMTMMENMKIMKKTMMTMTEISKKKKKNPSVTKLMIILVMQVLYYMTDFMLSKITINNVIILVLILLD